MRVRDNEMLQKHCNGFHNKENRGFLKYEGPFPNLNDQCYTNFNEYLINPNEVDLVKKEHKRGRPLKRKQSFMNTEAIPLELVQCIDEEGNFSK